MDYKIQSHRTKMMRKVFWIAFTLFLLVVFTLAGIKFFYHKTTPPVKSEAVMAPAVALSFLEHFSKTSFPTVTKEEDSSLDKLPTDISFLVPRGTSASVSKLTFGNSSTTGYKLRYKYNGNAQEAFNHYFGNQTFVNYTFLEARYRDTSAGFIILQKSKYIFKVTTQLDSFGTSDVVIVALYGK